MMEYEIITLELCDEEIAVLEQDYGYEVGVLEEGVGVTLAPLPNSAQSSDILAGKAAYDANGDIVYGGIRTYSGSYVATPKIIEQQIKSENMYMNDDIIVLAIPYYSTDNSHNGQTVIIGG